MKRFTLIFSLLILAAFFTVETQAQGLAVGDEAAHFDLMNIDKTKIGLDDYQDKDGVIVVFTCNHCPYSKMYEDRIIDLQTRYEPQGFPVVAINPNDAEQYPDDSFKNMKKRAKKKGFNFPYLWDGSQEVAQAYGAERTPHVYLLANEDGKFFVRYIGAIDDSAKDAEAVEETFLEDAIQNLKDGEEVRVGETKAVGCSIKWKKS